jgi:hypothetical protein
MQLLELFDGEMSISERLHAAEVLYTRCYNPLDFHETILEELPPMQVRVCVNLAALLLQYSIHNQWCWGT